MFTEVSKGQKTRIGSKKEFSSSHKAMTCYNNDICHLLGGFLHVNVRVVHKMISITFLRTLMDYRTDKVFLGLRQVLSTYPLPGNNLEENFQWKTSVPFLSPLCATLCIQVTSSPLTSLTGPRDYSRYGLNQVLAM